MTNHIYGKTKGIETTDRPHMFIKELDLYLDYLKTITEEVSGELNRKQIKLFNAFIKNLNEGITYYDSLFSDFKNTFDDTKSVLIEKLKKGEKKLQILSNKIENLKNSKIIIQN